MELDIPNKTIYNLARSFITFFVPESLAFSTDEKKYTITEFIESESLKGYVDPGDLILIRTPGSFATNARKILDFKYDHMAVFIDKNHVFHISPPKIRIIKSNFFLMSSREPLIIKVNLSVQERENFLNSLTNHISDDYNYYRFFKLAAKKGIEKLRSRMFPQYRATQKYNSLKMDDLNTNICTDLIAYYLIESSAQFHRLVLSNLIKLDFSVVGSFTTNDFAVLGQLGDCLQMVYHGKGKEDFQSIEKSLEEQQQQHEQELLEQNIYTTNTETWNPILSEKKVLYRQMISSRINNMGNQFYSSLNTLLKNFLNTHHHLFNPKSIITMQPLSTLKMIFLAKKIQGLLTFKEKNQNQLLIESLVELMIEALLLTKDTHTASLLYHSPKL